MDGALDEEAWLGAEPATGFVQGEPDTGQPATEQTEVRIVYDRDTLYIGASCHDRDGATAAVINDIRKDFADGEQDTFEVVIDTFGVRRNGYMFITNVDGARADQQVANEGREVNASWDAVWFVSTSKRADGWVVEMAIPFKSLRFVSIDIVSPSDYCNHASASAHVHDDDHYSICDYGSEPYSTDSCGDDRDSEPVHDMPGGFDHVHCYAYRSIPASANLSSLTYQGRRLRDKLQCGPASEGLRLWPHLRGERPDVVMVRLHLLWFVVRGTRGR